MLGDPAGDLGGRGTIVGVLRTVMVVVSLVHHLIQLRLYLSFCFWLAYVFDDADNDVDRKKSGGRSAIRKLL